MRWEWRDHRDVHISMNMRHIHESNATYAHLRRLAFVPTKLVSYRVFSSVTQKERFTKHSMISPLQVRMR